MPKASCELLTPQIAWHETQPVNSIDVSPIGFVATGGNDNAVRLWRLRLNKEASQAVCFLQDLTGHSTVRRRGLPPPAPRPSALPSAAARRSPSTSCASAPTASHWSRPLTTA